MALEEVDVHMRAGEPEFPIGTRYDESAVGRFGLGFWLGTGWGSDHGGDIPFLGGDHWDGAGGW